MAGHWTENENTGQWAVEREYWLQTAATNIDIEVWLVDNLRSDDDSIAPVLGLVIVSSVPGGNLDTQLSHLPPQTLKVS